MGIIPARAGFTGRTLLLLSTLRDHPRSRGVYSSKSCTRRVNAGSSPLARGLPDGACGEGADLGIIPARAGFTQEPHQHASSRPDHPRSRGVYTSPPCTRTMSSGSSPLARGLRGPTVQNSGRRGIIPARAGFTCRGAARHGSLPDHPRSRGVYRLSAVGELLRQGSSPLARGLLRPSENRLRAGGIIPARAGFTGSPASTHCRRTDHPRSRGVY